MKKILVLSFLAIFAFTACTSDKKIDSEDDFSVEAENDGGDLSLDTTEPDDLSLDTAKSGSTEDTDLSLENELDSLDEKPAQPKDELSLDDEPTTENVAQSSTPSDSPPLQEPPAPEVLPEQANLPPLPEPAPEPTMPVQAEAPTSSAVEQPATISNVQYKGNDNGGTIAISADKPLSFTTRTNSTTNQFIVEVQNAKIPANLKRILNTKDMASSIGSVDIYQKSGSNVSRFVVQMRPGSGEPIVQQEGNSLLVIGSAVALAEPQVSAPPPEMPSVADSNANAQTEQNETPTKVKNGILTYETLDEFLMNDTKYYGKKVNFETYGWETAEALRFLADEGNVNIMLDDSVATIGKVNLKLRDVPWDQAFVLILKAKKLVYKRQGNVIRVAKLEDLKKDEEEAIAMKVARKEPESLAVKRFFISYADLSEIQTKIAEYLKILAPPVFDSKGVAVPEAANSSVGKVITDKRNNSLIITDTETNLKKIEEIIAALDTQPKQILIEAKVVEANEGFSRGLGVTWASAGTAASTNRLVSGQIGIDSGLSVTPGFAGAVTWGQIDYLGSLTASLALGESESKVKVLSSPRITVLSNTSANITSTVDVQVQRTTISNGITTVSEESKPVGIQLAVTPIANNGGTVKLNLNLSRSASAGGGGTSSRQATTELFVKSGSTAVIGGIYNTTIEESVGGVPGLRDVPVLGALFQTQNTDKSKSELLMFVTPTILKPL